MVAQRVARDVGRSGCGATHHRVRMLMLRGVVMGSRIIRILHIPRVDRIRRRGERIITGVIRVAIVGGVIIGRLQQREWQQWRAQQMAQRVEIAAVRTIRIVSAISSITCIVVRIAAIGISRIE